jgi:hypothetical protein
MPNIRKLHRHRRRLNVSLGGRLPAITADVSAGGFCAELPYVFLPGSMIHGSIAFGEREVPFKGKVTWARAGDPQMSPFCRFGVRFTEIPTDFSSFFEKPEDRPLVRWHTS